MLLKRELFIAQITISLETLISYDFQRLNTEFFNNFFWYLRVN